MTDRQRDELRVVRRSMFTGRALWRGVVTSVIVMLITGPFHHWHMGPEFIPYAALTLVAGLAGWVIAAYLQRERFRFRLLKYGHLWTTIADRMTRFENAYRGSPKIVKDTLSDTPSSIRRVVDSIYMALRRADSVRGLIDESEKNISQMPMASVPAVDSQAQSLYDLAQKNQDEYRQHYQKLMAGVERTEAQTAVLISALDSLRLKMLDYRVTGGKVEMPSSDLVTHLEAYKTEFAALEKAVEEVESVFLQAGT